MNLLNAILTAIFQALLGPLGSWPPWLVLVGVSALAGVGMGAVFRYTSDQAALRAVAGRSRAQLMCLRIFKDDVVVALRCQGELLKATGLRLWYSLPPMAVVIVPFLLLLAQLGLYFENRPLRSGESVVVALRLNRSSWSAAQGTAIQVPWGVTVETPPLRHAAENTIWWRLRIESPPRGPLRWQVGHELVEKSIAGGGEPRLAPVSAVRPGPGLWDRLLRPGEPGFAGDSPVRAAEVFYPRRATPVLGIDAPWWLTFLVVSMVAALCAKPFLKVQF